MAIKDLIPMPLKKRNSLAVQKEEWNPFISIQQSMNQLFDDFFQGPSYAGAGSFAQSFPVVDIHDKGKNLVIKAELPGMDMKDVHIYIHDKVLTIRGEKKQEKEEKSHRSLRVERSYGSFYREIELPCLVEDEKIHAEYKHGVLKITLPKCSKVLEETKRIDVKIM